MHGSGLTHIVWSLHEQFLATKGYSILSVDLPGHGNNPRPIHQITLSNYVKHVCEIIDLQSDPVILVGHSLGGVTISQTAENRSNKIKYLQYVITPKGISERTKLTINFMQRKMKEYEELKKEVHNKFAK